MGKSKILKLADSKESKHNTNIASAEINIVQIKKED